MEENKPTFDEKIYSLAFADYVDEKTSNTDRKTFHCHKSKKAINSYSTSRKSPMIET